MLYLLTLSNFNLTCYNDLLVQDFQTSEDMLESPVFEVRSALSGCDDSRRIILFIDALNQVNIHNSSEHLLFSRSNIIT